MIDIDVEHQGSIVIFTPRNERASDWIEKNVIYQPWQILGNSLAVEFRYAMELYDGMREAGLELNDP